MHALKFIEQFVIKAVFAAALIACGGAVPGGGGAELSSDAAPLAPGSGVNPHGTGPVGGPGGGSSSGNLPTAANFANAPTQTSGAPSPGFDPNGVLYIALSMDSSEFVSSAPDLFGMVPAKLSGWADTSAVKAPDGSTISIDLNYHVLRVVDPEEKNYIDISIKNTQAYQFSFEITYLMTAERFQQASQSFDLEFSVSSIPIRNTTFPTYPKNCPEDVGCNRHLPVKAQWTPMAGQVEPIEMKPKTNFLELK